MPYYMRSNYDPNDNRYLMHAGLGTTVNNAWGNMKGSWSKAVKYVDKKIINGRMRYLYPEMLEKARSAANTVKTGVSNAKKSFNDFRNYSTNVDTRKTNASSAKAQNQAEAKRIAGAFKTADGQRAGLMEDLEDAKQKEAEAENRRTSAAEAAKNAYGQNQRDKNAIDIASDRYLQAFADNQKYQSNEATLEKMRADIAAGKDVDYEEMSRLEEENRRLSDASHRYEGNNSEDWLNTARRREGESAAELESARNDTYEATRDRDRERQRQADINSELDYDTRMREVLAEEMAANNSDYYKNLREETQAAAEQQSFRYKASRLLDNILDRYDDARDSASATITTGAGWLQSQINSGASWLSGIFGNRSKGQIENMLESAVDQAIPDRSMPAPAATSSGRVYNGIAQKAVRGEPAVSQAEINNAYVRLQEAQAAANGRSTPEVQEAMAEYLRLTRNPAGGARNARSYQGRPGK